MSLTGRVPFLGLHDVSSTTSETTQSSASKVLGGLNQINLEPAKDSPDHHSRSSLLLWPGQGLSLRARRRSGGKAHAVPRDRCSPAVWFRRGSGLIPRPR